ncbi:MAG: electron transport complex subunit E [Succinivibrionaceae bacterium]
MTIYKIFKDGIWSKNPGIVQLLGLCPLLATSSSAVNGLTLGIATIFVLTASNICISLIRKILIQEIRILMYVIIIACLVTCVQLLMEAFTPDLYATLGLYIALIVTNCIIIARAETFAAKNSVLHSACDGLANGVGFTLVLVFIGMCREFIGNGTLFSGFEQLIGPIGANLKIQIFCANKGLLIAILPPGAFITIGILIALKNYLDNRYKILKEKQRMSNTTRIN